MAKTREITFGGTFVRVSPAGRLNSITVEDPNMEDILNCANKDDVDNWVSQNRSPEDVFTETELSKWAEANGYVKGDQA